MSRFGRDYIQTGHYMERYFPEKSVRYISLLDGIDTGLELSANEITPFRAIINDLYAKDISKKIKSVKRDKQQKGLFIGWKPPYGYKSASDNVNVLEVDEVAAVVVKEIFEMALSGISCRQIATSLNDRGVATPAQYSSIRLSRRGPYSGLWSSERVAATLKNRVYVGDMVQRRMEKISYKIDKCRRLPEDQWVIVENTHEPIVSRQDFERVKLLIDSRKRTRRRTYDYLLKGLIYCKECQAHLGVVNRPLAGQDVTLYFLCRTYQRFTKNSACTSHCVKVECVADVVIKRIREICEKYIDQSIKDEMAELLEKELAKSDNAESEIRQMGYNIETITIKMDKLYDDRLNGIVENADFMRVYSHMKVLRRSAQERLAKLIEMSSAQLIFVDDIDSLAEQFISSAETNRELLCSLIERVEMSSEKELLIRHRFMPEETIRLQ